MSTLKDIKQYLEKLRPNVKNNLTIVDKKDIEQQYLLNITPNNVRSYYPRYPVSASGSEDRTTARITVSPSIGGCLIGYSSVLNDIVNGQMYRGSEYKNGYYIYGLEWDYALKPNSKLVYDARISDEHWLVNETPEYNERKPVLLGKIFPGLLVLEPKSSTIEDSILVSFYIEISKEVTIQVTRKQTISKGYWKLTIDMSTYSGYSQHYEGKPLSVAHDDKFILEEITVTEYNERKVLSASMLSFGNESFQPLYNMFFRAKGVRRLQNLLAPKLEVLDSLPRGSMLHYLSLDEEHPDIDTSKAYLQGYSKRIIVDYATELSETLGNPRRNSLLIRPLIRPFHIKNKQYRYLENGTKLTKDQLSLVIMSYSYLGKLYRYAPMPMSSYHKWYNIQKTLWTKIAEVSKEVQRNHFVFLKVPKELPSYTFLRLYSTKTNLAMLKIFDDQDKLMLLELWKWLDPETRPNSVLANIDESQFSSINIVFEIDDGRSSVVNLGYISSWIKDSINLTEFSNVSQLPVVQMQKLFLKFVMNLQSFNVDENTEEVVEEITDNKEDDIDKDEPLDYEDYNEDDDPEVETTQPTVVKTDITIPEDIDNYLVDDPNEGFDSTDLNKQLSNIDEDLKTLETMTTKKLKQKGIVVDKSGETIELVETKEPEATREEIIKKVFTNLSTEESLKAELDKFADTGLLSASDYKKLVKEVESYKSKKDPYGSNKPLGEAMLVTKEDLVLDAEKKTIVTSDLVIDKSMTESSLLSYDYDYITKVMPKDILSMVDGIQKAGVIVKKHEIEENHSALGSYETHTLELKPIDGVSSTVRFRIPKVEEDGTYVANSNKYQLRKQRVDSPIRKIRPTEVALTTYYGKTFVTMSEKKASSSKDWIYKQLDKASIEDHPYIKKVGSANVFDNNFKAPYIYNALANRYKYIKAGPYTLLMDHTERAELLKGKTISLEEVEQDRGILIGYTDRKEPLVVDMENQFHVLRNDGTWSDVGNIYDILQLDENKAPVDYSSVKILAKSLPVVMYLGYFIGLKNILKMLNMEYRYIEPRKQKNLEKYEFAVTFLDGTYIFSKKDKTAASIVAGLLEYEKELKAYSFDELNNKDVYLNLLNAKGMSSFYIREMENIQQLFVDPISKGLLEEMKEPTTFNGLLIRATEMLQSYDHPDSQDTKYMRIRGYERFAGVIYRQLADSIRSYKHRNIAGKSKIELSPYDIWQTIMKDPAVKLVEDINPIQNLKESEIVTYVGVGGRDKGSMNKASRAYHKNDMGVVSEATVDSSDVGINAYLSANPKFKNLRGLIDDTKGVTPSNLVSTSALLAVGADKDDFKRVN